MKLALIKGLTRVSQDLIPARALALDKAEVIVNPVVEADDDDRPRGRRVNRLARR